MSGLTLVEELGLGAVIVWAIAFVVVGFVASWRGIKIILVHRRNGEDE